jgi:simple sugar transport system permease protein
MTAMLLAGAAAGAAWAGIAAVLRITVRVNEAVTTLLLNYVALFAMLYLILGPWKDPAALGQSTSVELAEPLKLPVFAGTAVNVGVGLAVVAAVGVWFALTRTSWGFRLGVVGGNPEAARRAGIPVVVLLLSALLIGGALAGLAGFVQLAGTEYKLRPTFGLTIGYVAFLASWLARHKPLPLLLASLALAAIAVSGNSLQIGSGLPAASVNILMGLVLVAVLGWTGPRKAPS